MIYRYNRPDRQEALIGPSLYRQEQPSDHVALRRLYEKGYQGLREFRNQPAELNRQWQLCRLKELVAHAYRTVPMYRTKYSAVGFEPGDLKTWKDFERLPTLTKDDLIAAWPDACISDGHDTEFMTTSSGSSGRFVYVAVNEEAVLLDTIQGARQLDFQSGGIIGEQELTVNISTCIWYYSSIDGMYRVHFLPTRTPIEDALHTIEELRPAVLSAYPSYLRELAVAIADRLSSHDLRLVITHSEASSRREREKISWLLGGVPVLDEYSSEELTRIALECPKNAYHIEEDTVYLEILDPHTRRPCHPGERGEVVGTNLVNKATPLIRYHQGDLAALVNGSSCSCRCTFRQMSAPLGRIQDSFITPSNRVVPAGTLMDEAYHWVLEARIPVNGLCYQIIQKRIDSVQILLSPNQRFRGILDSAMCQTITERMHALLGERVAVETIIVNQLPCSQGPKHKAVISELWSASQRNGE